MDGNGVGGSGQRWAVSSSPPRRGPVAQLGERLTGSQKVRGSNPLGSTIFSAGGTRCGTVTMAMRSRVVGVIDRLEDVMYSLVAILLALATLLLLWSAASSTVSDLQHSLDPLTIVLKLLDRGLILFMVVELLHTVRITLHGHELTAEPFLIVGLIAAIRRVLLLTAESGTDFRFDRQGVELIILISLILVMSIAILIWRRTVGRSVET